MAISDIDQQRVELTLIDDLHATLGGDFRDRVRAEAENLRTIIDDVDWFTERVVENVQQQLHDEFIDTSWPRCPRHAHPLWYKDGWWCCQRDNVRVAPLGQLRAR